MDITPRVLGLIGKDTSSEGCYMWRIWAPVAELWRQGYSQAGWEFFESKLTDLIWLSYDALILPRLGWPDEEAGERWFNLVHKAGKTVIYEVDDDLYTDYIVERLVGWHDKTPEKAEATRRQVTWAMQQCDGVIVSSEHLRHVVEGLTDKPIVVVPNFIDLRWFREMKRLNERWIEPLTIGWAGGVRPDEDVEKMAIAWGRIAERFPDVTFVLMGHQAKIIFDNVPEERIKAIPWMTVHEYPAGMANIDIGCCPLDDMFFNRSKTYIKAMEYAALGAAVVASPLLYRQIIDQGVNGFICDTVDEWEQALATLITSTGKRKRMAKLLEQKVELHHSLEKNVWRWPAAWAEIIKETKRRSTHVLLPSGAEYALANGR